MPFISDQNGEGMTIITSLHVFIVENNKSKVTVFGIIRLSQLTTNI